MKLNIPLSVEDAILWRRDVRRFKPLPVDDQLLLRVLDLADHAPSVGNSQPWRVVMVETSDRRERVRQLHISANIAAASVYEADRRLQYQKLKLAGFDAAPIHIAVFCDETTKQGHGLGSRTMPEMLALFLHDVEAWSPQLICGGTCNRDLRLPEAARRPSRPVAG